MSPLCRVRITRSKQAYRETWLERDPTARLGKLVKDFPPEFVARYIRCQEEHIELQRELAVLLGEIPE